jgi:hypothetical protein
VKLYQITLPLASNDGRAYPERHFADFETLALQYAGGFTNAGEVSGMWQGPAPRFRLYLDRSRVYQVACEPDAWANLVHQAKHIWRDQERLAVATLGDFELV